MKQGIAVLHFLKEGDSGFLQCCKEATNILVDNMLYTNAEFDEQTSKYHVFGDKLIDAESVQIPTFTYDGTRFHVGKKDATLLVLLGVKDGTNVMVKLKTDSEFGLYKLKLVREGDGIPSVHNLTEAFKEYAKIEPSIGPHIQSEFVVAADIAKLQLFQCPTDGHTHFRHAGYVLAMMPYVDKQESKLASDAVPVYICIKCKTPYIMRDGKLHDVSEQVDLEAWTKTEKHAHKQTGAGGQC